jgi:hypothetical protein
MSRLGIERENGGGDSLGEGSGDGRDCAESEEGRGEEDAARRWGTGVGSLTGEG